MLLKEPRRDVVERYSGSALQLLYVLVHLHTNPIQILRGILVLHTLDVEVQLVILGIAIVELVSLWNIPLQALPDCEACFVCPAPTHIFHSVATAAEHDQRQPIRHHLQQAVSVALDAEVEMPQFIVTEGICAQLHDNGSWAVLLHDGVHDLHEQTVKGLIVDPYSEGNIQRVILAGSFSYRIAAACSREKVIAVLVEGNRHNSVGKKESLLDSISMMNIYVQVQHSGVELQQLQNGQHDVVGVAEAAGFTLFGVVQPTAPVDTYVSLSAEEDMRSINRPAAGILAEFVEPAEAGTVSAFSHVELVFLFCVSDDFFPLLVLQKEHIVGVAEAAALENVPADMVFEVADVLGVVESHEFLSSCQPRSVSVQFSVQVKTLNQGVGHADALRLHGVVLGVVKLSHLLVVEVSNPVLAAHPSLLIIRQRVLAQSMGMETMKLRSITQKRQDSGYIGTGIARAYPATPSDTQSGTNGCSTGWLISRPPRYCSGISSTLRCSGTGVACRHRSFLWGCRPEAPPSRGTLGPVLFDS